MDQSNNSVVSAVSSRQRWFVSGPCVFRVHPTIRMLDPNVYTPYKISIGPIHYGSSDSQLNCKEYKVSYFQQFLEQTSVPEKDFYALVKAKEVELRSCYLEPVPLGSEYFVKMILLDAVFVIELLLTCIPRFSITMDYKFSGRIDFTVVEIMLLENQLPLFILEDIFNLANLEMPDQCDSMSQLTRLFFSSYISDYILINDALIESHFSKAMHLLDLLRLCMKPPQRRDSDDLGDAESVPSLTALHQAGIKVELASTKDLLDLTFQNATLRIPRLTVHMISNILLKNLQVSELMLCDTHYINDYNVMFSGLLRSLEDVQLLVGNGVLQNWVTNDRGVLTLFQDLDTRFQRREFCYSGLVKDLNRHCRSRRNQWKARLKPHTGVIILIVACILIRFIWSIIQL